MTSRFYVAFVLLAALLGLPAAAYKPLCKDSAGRLVQCAGTLDNTHAPAAPTMSGANITSGTIGAGSITGGSANRIMIDGGTTATWSNTIVGATISCASNTCTNLPTAALSGTVGVSNGGTGKNTWTVGAIPVASGVATIAEIAPGTVGHVLTSNGAGVAPSYQAPAAATVVAAKFSGTYSASTSSWANVGLALSLTSGKWHVVFEVRNLTAVSAGAGFARLRLYDSTAGAVVTDSERQGILTTGTGGGTTTITMDLDLNVPTTLDLQAARDTAATYSACQIIGDADGWTRATAFLRAA